MNVETVSKLWSDYQHGLSYQGALGIDRQIPQNVDFFEGRQWAPPTENTKNMPRPVVNIVKLIARNKKSGVLSSRLKLNFRSEEDTERSTLITAFNEYIEKEMGMEGVREKLVWDGVIKGCGFLHYYWDAEARGAEGNSVGGVRAEVIDPLNIFFHNPKETDEQKQKWILIASRVEVDAVKAMAGAGVDKDLIEPDEYETKYDDKEQDGSELCTVLTRYFRKNGEVYFERATKKVVLHKPIALTPETTEELPQNAENADAVEMGLSDAADKRTEPYKARLYPIVAYSYEKREKSIYGLSEVEGIIPNQKAINFNIGMQLLAVQNQAWGKYIVRKGALQGQKITNQPGQVLVDHSASGDGIRKMTEQPFSQMPMQLVDSLVNMTRTITGSTEVMTGETLGKNQSGAAIAQLQSQALKPIEDLRKAFWRACERGGLIVEQFYKLYYEEKPYVYTDDDGNESREVFKGADYQDLDFSVTVEAGGGTQFSEAMTISLLGDLFQSQSIDLSTYVELFPDSAMPFKGTLKKQLQAREESENAQLKAALQQAQAQIEQLTAYVKEQETAVQNTSSVVRQNRQLNELLGKLQTEYTDKIQQANTALQQSAARNAEVTNDAAYMAAQLAGISNNAE